MPGISNSEPTLSKVIVSRANAVIAVASFFKSSQ